MKPSAPPCGRPCWIQTLIIFAGLAAALWLGLHPAAISPAPDFNDGVRGKQVFDESGRLVE